MSAFCKQTKTQWLPNPIAMTGKLASVHEIANCEEQEATRFDLSHGVGLLAFSNYILETPTMRKN